MTRRAAIAIVVALAWVAGSTVGSIADLPAASARTPGVVFGRAHGGYVPGPDRPTHDHDPRDRIGRPAVARTRSPRARTRST